MGRPFCKNFLILVKCPRDSRKKSDWFRCEKISQISQISQKLKYLNSKCEQSGRSFFVLLVSPLCACPLRKTSLATSEKSEWKSGLIFITVRTQRVYFSTSFRLGPADRFLAVLCVCRGLNRNLIGNTLVAILRLI